MNGLRLGMQAMCIFAVAAAGWHGTANAKPLTQHWGQIYAVAFSPDGARVASASAKHLEVHVVASGKRVSRVGLQRGPRCLAFAPGGERLVVDASVIDVRSSQIVETLEKASDRSNTLNAVAFAPDGKTIAVAPAKGPVKLVSANGGQLLHTLSAYGNHAVNAVAFSPDGSTVATASGDRVWLWSAKWGKSVGNFESDIASIRALAFSPDGQTIAVSGSGRTIELWASGGQRLHVGTTDGSVVASLVFTADGKTLVGGGSGTSITLWNAGTLQTQRSIAREGSGSVTALDIAPDGRRAVIGDSTGAVRLIEIARR